MEKECKLILQDGTSFIGKSFGAEKNISGEVVFNTSMMGYPETLTDPSYKGQILVLTYPLIGNYGVPSNEELDKIKTNFESNKIHIQGLIISDYSFKFNHWNSDQSLHEWLIKNNIPGIYDIDTREITKKLRKHGVMLGQIYIDEKINFENPFERNLVDEVSVKEKIVYEKGNKKVLLIDCGVKNNIIRCFLKRGISVIRVPWDYDFSNEEYDALFISNGPGDPKKCEKTVNNLKKALLQDKPIFGICLGSQLLALAAGANTYKLKYGHRSQNQPCIEVGTKKCYITSQNHGFAVDDTSLPNNWVPWFVNANDGTNEGIKHETKPFFAVQFHPEAKCGPTDTEFLFDKFVEIM